MKKFELGRFQDVKTRDLFGSMVIDCRTDIDLVSLEWRVKRTTELRIVESICSESWLAKVKICDEWDTMVDPLKFRVIDIEEETKEVLAVVSDKSFVICVEKAHKENLTWKYFGISSVINSTVVQFDYRLDNIHAYAKTQGADTPSMPQLINVLDLPREAAMRRRVSDKYGIGKYSRERKMVIENPKPFPTPFLGDEMSVRTFENRSELEFK